MHSYTIDLNKLLKPLLKAKGNILYQLIEHWEDITSHELNKFSTPRKILYQAKGKVLLVVCHNQAVMTELYYLEPVILEKLKIFLGHDSIKKLKLQNQLIMQEVEPSERQPVTNLPSQINSLLQDIQDPTLQQALTKLGQLFYGK